MLRTIHLYGSLRKRYGKSFELDCASAQEAAQALGFMIPGFQRDIVDGVFQVIAGPKKSGYHLGQDEVRLTLGKTEELHIVPVPQGAKRGGVMKLILGIALIGLSFVPGVNAAIGAAFGSVGGAFGATAAASATAFGTSLLFKTGFMLALGGAYQAIVGTPTMPSSSTDEGFLFSGPVNTSVQGSVVPVVFGKMMVGSVVVSGGISPENIPV